MSARSAERNDAPDQLAPARGLARQLVRLVPPLRHWLDDVDRLAREAELWRTVRIGVESERLINASRQIIAADAAQGAILDFLSILTPRRAAGFGKIRLGRDGDGGYVLLDDFTNVGAALSFGIERDCSWDTAIAERGIDVHQYDHTVDGPPTANARFRFFKKQIAAVPSDQSESLGSALAKLPSTAERVILKMDIEGAEWEVLDAATPEELARFSQIIGEFHDFGNVADPAWREMAGRVLTKLRSVFEIVHVHANNLAPFNIVANVPFPAVMELTLANRAIYQCHETDEIFPTPLDQPNWHGRPDIFLGIMRYR